MENGFTDADLKLMKSLKYDSSLKPNHEFLKGCLVWDDERPLGLTQDGKRIVGALHVARALLHKGLTLDDQPLDPAYYKQLWAMAQSQLSDWPGFKRLTLNEEDKRYFEKELAEASSGDV